MRTEPLRTRLVDLSPDARPGDVAQAGAELLRKGDPAASLNPAVSQRIAARLASKVPAASASGWRLRPLRWRWAVAAALLVPAITVAVVRLAPLLLPALTHPSGAPDESRFLKQLDVPGAIEPIEPIEPSVTPPIDAPAPDLSPVSPSHVPSRSPNLRRKRTSAQTPPAPSVAQDSKEETELTLEARLIALALRQMRQEKNPNKALTTLADYRSQFPRGLLAREAELARVDALLLMDRRRDALGVLETLNAQGFSGVPRADEMKLLRGELLAELGQCAEAMPAFEAAISLHGAEDLRERAWFWRASCRAAQGDIEGSRMELKRYLELFPGGRFAPKARSALDRGP